MLWKILQAYNGKLPEDIWVVFANTGKEAPETMREQCFPALPNLAKYFQDIRENS